MKNKYLTLAALSGFFCVALGAFAAHGLSHVLEAKALSWIDTSLNSYQSMIMLWLLIHGLNHVPQMRLVRHRRNHLKLQE